MATSSVQSSHVQDIDLLDVLERQLLDESLLRLWRTGADYEEFRPQDDDYALSDLSAYLQKGEFFLSKNVDVALWLDYRAYTNQACVEEVRDFVVVNDPLFKEFEDFRQEYTTPGISQVPVIKLLELWITAQESVDVVQQFGHKYAVLHQSAMDDLVLWLLNVRDRFDFEGRAVLRTLQKEMLDQQPAPLVPRQPSSTNTGLPTLAESAGSESSDCNTSVNYNFVVGECFSSYKQLKDKIEAYEKAMSIQLGHRDSRTLDAAKKRVPKRVEGANSELKYYSVHLACIFGGKSFKSQCKGIRKHQQTFKQGCPAGIKLCLSADRKYLEVKEVVEDHNHEVSKAIYDHLPRQRRLNECEQKEAEQLLRMKVNSKLLQQHLIDATGKVVTLKDIRNVQTGIHAQSDKNNLEALVTRLRQIHGSTVEIFTSEDQTFSGLFFQDRLMKAAFAAYPEVFMIDATYKLNELRMPVYLMVVIDCNGQSEIVGLFITVSETEEAITKMVQAFKAHNPDWPSTNVVMTDKDFTERAVFLKEFPSASLLICLFHTMRSMKREVTCEKLGLSPGERDHALEIMTELVYSKSEAEYLQHYQTLLDSGLKSVIYYYNSNWHPIRKQWVECFKGANFTFGETSNNRLESINAKVKSVCSKYASLATFFDQFFAVLSCLRNERDHVTLMAMVKKRVTTLPHDSPEEQFAKLLSPYAFRFVEKQLALRNKVQIVEEDDVRCIVSSSAGYLNVTGESCECTFRSSMHLPCRHMFAVREKMKLPVYSPIGVAERWKLTYMRDVYYERLTATPDDSFQITSVNKEQVRAVLSQQQKFRKALSVAQELSSLASEVGMAEFEERLTLLKQLRDAWANGQKAIVESAVVNERDNESISCDDHHNEGGDESKLEDSEINSGPESDSDVQTFVKESDLTSNDYQNQSGKGPECDDADTSSECLNVLQKIKLPAKVRKRGRPKGAEKTVIGLPKKKKRGNKPVPFLKKCPADKERVILVWFVEPAVADAALAGTILIEEEQVEMRPEKVPASCLDENVCIMSCRKYFSRDAWIALSQVMELKKRDTMWYCGRCDCPIMDSSENSIVCDCCLVWYHFKCCGLRQSPKSRVWFCRSCYNH